MSFSYIVDTICEFLPFIVEKQELEGGAGGQPGGQGQILHHWHQLVQDSARNRSQPVDRQAVGYQTGSG